MRPRLWRCLQDFLDFLKPLYQAWAHSAFDERTEPSEEWARPHALTLMQNASVGCWLDVIGEVPGEPAAVEVHGELVGLLMCVTTLSTCNQQRGATLTDSSQFSAAVP